MTNDENILGKCMYFTTGSLSRCVNDVANIHFEDLGISPSHAFLLVVIDKKDKANIKDLASELNLAHSTVSRNLELHIKKGYLIKTTESRSTFVHLTESGQEILQQIHHRWQKIHADFLDAFDGNEEEYIKFNRQALSIFEKLHKKL